MKVRKGSGEEIPLVQGTEQWLRFAGAAEEIPHTQGKRNPSKTVGVAREHQRADTLKPYSQKTSQPNHTDHSLVSLNETNPCPWGNPRQAGHGGEI